MLELAVEVYEVVVLCACAGMTARRPTAAKTTIAATFRAVGLPMPMFISVFSSPPVQEAVAGINSEFPRWFHNRSLKNP